MRGINVETIETDKFTEMSHEAQLLYIHYCLNAKKDGCLWNAKAILRGLGFSQTSYTELKLKGYIEECEKCIRVKGEGE